MTRTMPEQLSTDAILFACQECGKTISFPADSGGHVEVCPECGRYVDVPSETETPSPAGSDIAASGNTAQQVVLDPNARTTAQLWFEVSAVLCLAYVPWQFHALASFYTSSSPRSFSVGEMLYRILESLQVSMPLVAIITLTKDGWSRFGIVRPKWVIDAIIGCVVCFLGFMCRDFAKSLLPLPTPGTPTTLHATHWSGPDGMIDWLTLIVACIASGFTQELIFRGYLIPRFECLLRSTWVALLVTTALFASYHVYQGTSGTVGAAAIGFVYAIAFCLLRRLWPLCVAHSLHNILVWLWFTR
jgi:membrane protease YdiL (CAAX protease family)